jgi:hypothetical protein
VTNTATAIATNVRTTEFWEIQDDVELTEAQEAALATIVGAEHEFRFIMDKQFVGMYMAGMINSGNLTMDTAPTAEQYQIGLKGFMQFCAARVINEVGELAVPGRETDAAWHGIQLYSSLWRKFCNDVFGKPFDHFPLDTSDAVALDYVCELMFVTARVFARTFKGWTPFIGINFEEMSMDELRTHAKICCYGCNNY